MADFVKKKIVEKLAKFTKHLKPSDISLSFLSGKGHLSNLELNGEVISEMLQLPPWVIISKVVCDSIRARVPFTSINTDPVNFYIGQVLVEITTATNTTAQASGDASNTSRLLLNKLGSNPSKYSLIEKVIDGMRIEVRSVLLFFNDPTFHAQLEMTDIVMESTSWDWKIVPLSKARVKNEDEDSIINYKVCSWSSLKIEGWSTTQEQQNTHNQLRLIVGASKIYITFKRNMSDSSIMSSRIVLNLGDLIWILTQSQLRAVSHLVQSLMDTAVQTHQLQRAEAEAESDRDSDGSLESVSSEMSTHRSTRRRAEAEEKKSKSKKRKSKSSVQKNKLLQERIAQYREGKLNLPSYEVIQNSLHVKTGKVDLQLCDDTSGGTDTVQGSMLIEVFQLVVDVYLDQPAGSGRAHWNKSNDIIENNKRWSSKLITTASKTQFVELPSVNLSFLRERGVVIRCSNFSVGALRKGGKKKSRKNADLLMTLPIITSDKATFNIPDDIHNPAFQVGVSLYFYPDKYGNKFLVPRPNVLVCLSPVHVNVHQESCLWLVEFIHGLVKTVNIQLALTVKDEGKSFLEEKMAQTVKVERVPGLDMKLKILFTKVSLPLPEAADDGRPKALQIETAAIKVKNCPVNELRVDPVFADAVQAVKEGWLFRSQESGQFPHYQGDLRALPIRLQELLNQEVRVGRRRGECGSEDSCETSATALAPEDNRAEMASFEGWYVTTNCVHVAFANSYSHKATLQTKTFVDDFPVHMWLFLPPSSPDTSLPPSPSIQPTSLLQDPKFSFIAHIPAVVKAELERLQLLFIMRLKDSFTAFKTSLMKFLDPDTFAPHLKETLAAHRLANRDADMEPATPPMTISGCVVLDRLEASILLPTLHNPKTSQDAESAHKEIFTEQPPAGRHPSPPPPVHISPVLEESVTTGIPPSPTQTPSPVLDQSDVSLTSSSNSLTPSLLSLTGSSSPSLTSLPVIVETAPPHRPRTHASTSDIVARQDRIMPARSHSAVELHPLQETTPLRETTPLQEQVTPPEQLTTPLSEQGTPLQLSREDITCTSEEDFVLIKSPGNKPVIEAVLIEQASSILTNLSTDGSTPAAPPPSFLSPSIRSTSPSPSDRSSASRRVKTPPPLRTVPQFVLHAQVGNILALPNIKTGEIAAKVSTGTIALRELSTTEYEGMKELRSSTAPSPAPSAPTIKARLEVGDQVGRFYPPECAEEQDIIVIAKAEGLDISLLLPNITIMKDFFDDEYETLLPVPIHMKVGSTRAVLLEDLTHSADHVQSMSVGVEQLEVHRGRELRPEADIFLESTSNMVSRRDSTVAPLPVPRPLPHVPAEDSNDDQLLHSFSDFISVFESHVQHHGRVHLPHPQRIGELLQELQSALKPHVSPPPRYTEVASYSYLHSSARRSSTELLHLRRENEQLRQVQRQCERLSAQLKESQVEVERRETDLMMVTVECKKTKEELVSYKQVMEKQQEHIEKLLAENFDLQRQLLAPS